MSRDTARPAGFSWSPSGALLLALTCSGCAPVASGPVTDDQLDALLARLARLARGTVAEGEAWEAAGRGRMLTTTGTARIVAGDAGRYRLEVDAPVSYAEVHDGASTWKRYP